MLPGSSVCAGAEERTADTHSRPCVGKKGQIHGMRGSPAVMLQLWLPKPQTMQPTWDAWKGLKISPIFEEMLLASSPGCAQLTYDPPCLRQTSCGPASPPR